MRLVTICNLQGISHKSFLSLWAKVTTHHRYISVASSISSHFPTNSQPTILKSVTYILFTRFFFVVHDADWMLDCTFFNLPQDHVLLRCQIRPCYQFTVERWGNELECSEVWNVSNICVHSMHALILNMRSQFVLDFNSLRYGTPVVISIVMNFVVCAAFIEPYQLAKLSTLLLSCI